MDFQPKTAMDKLKSVLASYVADSDDTKDKLLGAAVAITTASGTYSLSLLRHPPA
jgi:hypothetical protein